MLSIGAPGLIFRQPAFGGAPFGSVRKLQACFQCRAVDSVSFFAVLRAMRWLEWLQMERNTGRPLAIWANADDQAEICPPLNTLIVIANANTETVGHRVQIFRQVRERAGVPIAHVEIVMAVRP